MDNFPMDNIIILIKDIPKLENYAIKLASWIGSFPIVYNRLHGYESISRHKVHAIWISLSPILHTSNVHAHSLQPAGRKQSPNSSHASKHLTREIQPPLSPVSGELGSLIGRVSVKASPRPPNTRRAAWIMALLCPRNRSYRIGREADSRKVHPRRACCVRLRQVPLLSVYHERRLLLASLLLPFPRWLSP